MSLRIFVLLVVFYLASGLLLAGSCRPPAIAASAATNDPTWRRFTGKDEEFSVLMPGQPSLCLSLITDNSGKRTFERIYSSYSKGSVYLIVSYDGGSIEGTLENFRAHHLSGSEVTYANDISLPGYSGKQYQLKSGDVTGALQIYATKKHGYALATIQAIDDPPLRVYFLSTFALTAKGDNQEANTTPPQGPPPNQASDLPQIDPSQPPLGGKYVTRRAVVVSKPEPWYPEEARQAGVTGTVVLRAVLSSSGEVTNIVAVSRLPNKLTESAFETARHLKFIPAVKDGSFVSCYVQLEYNFGLY
jgi:TonB family protein